jgi:hypothetical protein
MTSLKVTLRRRDDLPVTNSICLGIFLSPLVLSITSLPTDAFAQSGSVGGQIGKDNKSVSGSVAAPRSVQPSNSAGANKPNTQPSNRASRKDNNGSDGGNFDGAWIVLATGTPCGNSSESLVISGGRITGDLGSSGQVGPNGSTTGQGSSSGLSWTTSGRFSGRNGAGTFVRSDGCQGRWTASKR